MRSQYTLRALFLAVLLIAIAIRMLQVSVSLTCSWSETTQSYELNP